MMKLKYKEEIKITSIYKRAMATTLALALAFAPVVSSAEVEVEVEAEVEDEKVEGTVQLGENMIGEAPIQRLKNSNVAPKDSVTFKRLAGKNRVLTAIKVSEDTFKDKSAKNVVLVGSNGEVDALSAVALAKFKKAPILLVDKESVSGKLERELERLGAKNIFVVGGENSVSEEVFDSLDETYKVERISGKNRIETSIEISKIAGKKTKDVIIANGYGALVDALAIGPVSYKDQTPILLTDGNGLTDAVKEFLDDNDVENITIVGGAKSVSQEIEDSLVNDYDVERVAGKDRVDTSYVIANKYFEESKVAYLTNGRVVVDALVGGVPAGMKEAPILLTNGGDKLSDDIKDLVDFMEIRYVLGGEKTVSKEIAKELEADKNSAQLYGLNIKEVVEFVALEKDKEFSYEIFDEVVTIVDEEGKEVKDVKFTLEFSDPNSKEMLKSPNANVIREMTLTFEDGSFHKFDIIFSVALPEPEQGAEEEEEVEPEQGTPETEVEVEDEEAPETETETPESEDVDTEEQPELVVD